MGQLTKQMGSPHEGQKLSSYVAPGGTQAVKASSREGAQGTHQARRDSAFTGVREMPRRKMRRCCWKKGEEESCHLLPLFCFGPRVGAGWLEPPHKRAVAEAI